MARLWKVLMMAGAAALVASCGGGGFGGACSDDDVAATFFYGYGLQGTVGIRMRVEPEVTGVPTGCGSDMRFSVDSGTLPPGIDLDGRSGVISGVPTRSGRYPFTVRLTLKGFGGGLNARLISAIRDPGEASFGQWEVMSERGLGFLDDFRIGAIGSNLYVIARGFYTGRTETFRSADGGRTWTELNTRPGVYLREFALASDGTHIYMSGGRGRGLSSAVWRFDGTTWTQMTDAGAFEPRAGHTMLVHEGSLYILGGYGAGNNPLGDVWRSADGGTTWMRQSAAAFPPRYRFCALSDGKGSLHVIGGRSTPRDTSEYRGDLWQSRDDGATWTQNPIATGSPLLDALGTKSASCALVGGRMVYAGESSVFSTVSSSDGRHWLYEPHIAWLSGLTPGAVTMGGQMYVLTGEGTSQRRVIRTAP